MEMSISLTVQHVGQELNILTTTGRIAWTVVQRTDSSATTAVHEDSSKTRDAVE